MQGERPPYRLRGGFDCPTCIDPLLRFVRSPVRSLGLVQPRDLSFSEVTSRSFRTSWEMDATDVESFLLQFRPAEVPDGHLVSVSIPGDTLTTVLPYLTPLTRYQVNVSAQYDRGDSLPLVGYETTLEGSSIVPLLEPHALKK